jgi:hypothetical protein
MTSDGIFHHFFKFFHRICVSKNTMIQSFGRVSSFGSFFNQKNYLTNNMIFPTNL